MKKVLSIVLALVMVCALSISVFAEEVIYSMTSTGGQFFDNVSLADGAVLDDGGSEPVNMARIATNWQNGAVYDAVMSALKTEGGVIRITYTGTITTFGIQCDANGGVSEEIAIADVTEVDGKNVAIVSCDDLAAVATVGLSDNVGGWCNVFINYEGETKLYGFEVVTGYVAAPAESAAPADNTPAETTAPAAEAAPAEDTAPSTPANTGIVLAVLPMAIAAAAAVVSKRR